MNIQSVEIIPGIFEKESSELERRINIASPYVDWIQIDIADGIFVPNTSILDSNVYRKFTAGKVNFELHLMVQNPDRVLKDWIQAGFKRFLIHIESLNDLSKLPELKKICLDAKREFGLAVDRDTTVETIYPYLHQIDCVLVMTIKAGFSGQSFIPTLLEKVKKLRIKAPRLPIEVDGGINEKTVKPAVSAGATRLVTTSFIFNAPSIKQAIDVLRNNSQ